MVDRYQSFCRTCSSKATSVTDIFDKNQNDNLHEMIFFCTSIKVTEDDNLSHQVCDYCLNVLKEFYSFRELTVKSEISFKNNLTTSNNNPCRICLADTSPLMYIFDKNRHDNVKAMLVSVTAIKISEDTDTDDELPYQICYNCLNKIKRFFFFRELTLKSNALIPEIQNDTTPIFKCKFCESLFLTDSRLQKHLEFHNTEKPFKCKHCDKSYAILSTLEAHARQHTDIASDEQSHLRYDAEKPYKCKHCDKTFTLPISLAAHSKIHSKIKPYYCNVCKASFTRRGNLRTHMKLHFSEKTV